MTPNPDTPTLHVYRNDVIEWFVASSPDDAAELAREHYRSIEREADDEDFQFAQEDDDESMPIRWENGKASDGDVVVEKTFAEWAREKGRGFLCTTEW